MANNLADLSAHLFAQLDRISDAGLDPEQLELECRRAEAIVDLADKVTDIAKTQLTAAKLYAEHGAQVLPHLPQIGKADGKPGGGA